MKYLALGDSYTIGTSVALEVSYPHQLAALYKSRDLKDVEVSIVATRGWTTVDLITNLPPTQEHFDLVTLLIGVNDLYDGLSYEEFCSGAKTLIEASLSYAGSSTARVIVLTIPDYTFTPFAVEKQIQVSLDIDRYNTALAQLCKEHGVACLDIVDVSRRGIDEPYLVADDGLHLSGQAYQEFAQRIYAVKP